MGLKEWLNGKKTYIGGIGFIASGVADICIAFYEETVIDWNIAIGKILGGIVIIGGGHKLQKLIDL